MKMNIEHKKLCGVFLTTEIGGRFSENKKVYKV